MLITKPIVYTETLDIIEISYFLRLTEPSLLFCNERYFETVEKSLKSLPELKPDIVLCNALPALLRDMDFSSFMIPDASLDDTAVLVFTSGSSGLPKLCVLSQRGLVAKLSVEWYHSTNFPTPTALALLFNPPSGAIFHRIVTSCIAFSVPLLLPLDTRTEEWVEGYTHGPTWALFVPYFAKSLLSRISAEHLSSLRRLILSGTQVCEYITSALRTYSTVATSKNGEPYQLLDLYEYKLVDEDGLTVGLCVTGELCLKGSVIAKRYYGNNEELLTDGWLKTGDLFYIDEERRLTFKGRNAICFKFMYSNVSPEEVENIISTIPGVSACVVGSTERGAAAVVVASGVTRDQVHRAVNDTMSLHMRLLSGVGFVASLPVLHTGKVDRVACNRLIQELLATGDCC